MMPDKQTNHQCMMEDTADDKDNMTSQQELCISDQMTSKRPISTLKFFILALSFTYFSKALTGAYMKSSITQIERRFDLSSSFAGLIDGGFEIGNLLLLAVVSHFGAKMHRPRLIAMGCLLMSIGALITALPHFFMGRYKYNTFIQTVQNESVRVGACVDPLNQPDELEIQNKSSVEHTKASCQRDPGSHMWIYVFLGNVLRGIGDTPVTPLGISYIDDFATADNSPFYIACLQTISILGPMVGLLLGSYCAKLYVDIGFVDLDDVIITPKDARWVGAWWLGFLVSSALLFLSGIPFWFLPRSSPKQGGDEGKSSPIHGTSDGTGDAFNGSHNNKLANIAKGFLPSLKRLLGTPAYFLLLCGSVLQFNSVIGLLTFKAKYIEQQFGQSASRANFLIAVLIVPVVAVGIFLGGLLMKRYKLSVVSGAQLSFATSIIGYILLLLQFGTKCDNIPVAGITISYNGTGGVSYNSDTLFAECNRDCSCSAEDWDPVCSESGITYISPCLAGCLKSSGYGRSTIFHNCSCVSTAFPAGGSMSVKLGQCPRAKDCSRSFTSFMAISALSSFINSLGITPGYMVIVRCISPDLKSLALGIQTLVIRTLAGIPAPVYFGALIDLTCLKWVIKKCGGRGACRMYNADIYRFIYLGLITCLSGSSYFFAIAVIIILRRQFQKPEQAEEVKQPQSSKEIELQTPSNALRDQPSTPKNPKPESIQVKMETEPEIHTTEQLQGGRPLSIHNTEEEQQLKSTTETQDEIMPASSDGSKIKTDKTMSRKETQEVTYEDCEETNAKEREDGPSYTGDEHDRETNFHCKET